MKAGLASTIPLLAAVLFAGCETNKPTATTTHLPKEVLIGTDYAPASEFAPWVAADSNAYAGNYSMETGDTMYSLKLRVTKAGDQVFVSGSKSQATAGERPVTEPIQKTALSGAPAPGFKAGSGEAFFVIRGGKQKGLVLGEMFYVKH